MLIRPAEIKDLKGIKKLVAQFPSKLMQDIPNVLSFFVATERGEIVGCCSLDIYNKRIAEIRSLAVEREFQKLGIGSALIEACLRKAEERKIREVFAITGKIDLFRGFGFDTFHQEKFAIFKKL